MTNDREETVKILIFLSEIEIFSDEISARPGSTGLLFLRDQTQPSLLYSGQNTAVSLTPLLCPHNILTGSLVHSHWSSNVESWLLLVESFIVLKYFHSDATPALLCHKEPAQGNESP